MSIDVEGLEKLTKAVEARRLGVEREAASLRYPPAVLDHAWGFATVTVEAPALAALLASHAALAARVGELEKERDEAREVGRFVKSELDAAEARAEAAERRAGELEGALREAEATLALVEHPRREDPIHGVEVNAIGARIGYGALMASAQASWRAHLEASGDPLGGEYVAGPCFATVQDTLRVIRSALLPATQAEGEK